MRTVTTYLMQNFMQRGLGSFLNSQGNDKASMSSALSRLQSETSRPDDGLVQMIKNSLGLKDDSHARQYTQQALSTLQQHTNYNPQEVHSALQNHATDKGLDLGGMLKGFL
jgi:hypothetical protein